MDTARLCTTAVAALKTPPADPILASIFDHLVQAALDYGYFDQPITRLQIVLAGFEMAAHAIEADEILKRLRQF